MDDAPETTAAAGSSPAAAPTNSTAEFLGARRPLVLSVALGNVYGRRRVCGGRHGPLQKCARAVANRAARLLLLLTEDFLHALALALPLHLPHRQQHPPLVSPNLGQIGRASCRERV